MSSTEPLFMTAAELAAEADCTTERIEELARQGILPGIKWGRSWRFARAGLVQDIAQIARAEAEERRAKKPEAPVKPQRRRAPPDLSFVR